MLVKWETGQADINLDNYFPTSQNRLKQFVKKIIMISCNSDDHINTIHEHLVKSAEVCEEQWKEESKKYWNIHQKIVDTGNMVKTCKHANGVPLTKAEIKTAKKDLKELKQKENSLLQNVKNLKRKKQKLNQNKTTLEEFCMIKWES